VSEDYGPVDQAFVGAMGALQGLVGSAQAEMLGLETYEYAMVPVDELNERARDRWRVIPLPPSQEITQGLSGPRAGPLTFLMERKVIVGDTAEGLRGIDYNGHFPGGM
jgi:hypothetical protein